MNTGSNNQKPLFAALELLIPVSGITLSINDVTLKTGQTQALTANILPVNATNKAVAWSTGDAAIATVDAEGVVTAVGPGTTTITATTSDGGKTVSSSITVTQFS